MFPIEAFSEILVDLVPYWLVPVGLLLLYIYGRHHFNTPEYPVTLAKEPSSEDQIHRNVKRSRLAQLRTAAPPIFTVPRDRYRRHARYYVYGLWSVFLLIVIAPELFGFAMQQLAGGEPSLPSSPPQRAVWGLFALTGLLSSFPGLRELDAKILSFLHRRAEIPDDARDTAEQLFDADFDPDDEQALRLRQELGRRYVPDNDRNAFTGRLEEDWFRVACLWKAIKHLTRERRYRLFRRRFEDDMDETEEIYAHQERQIQEYKNLEAQLVPDGLADIDGFLLEQTGDDFEQLLEKRKKLSFKVESLLYRLCIISSLLAYATEPSIEKIDARFKKLGFKVKVKPLPRLDTDTLLKTCLALFVAIIVPSAIYGMLADDVILSQYPKLIPKSGKEATFWSLGGVALHGMSIFAAIFMKRYFAKKRLERATAGSKDSVFTRNIVIALIAMAIGYLLTVILGVLIAGVVNWSSPWSIGAAVTAYFVAVYIDRVVEQKSVTSGLVISHACAMGASALAAVFFSLVDDFSQWPTALLVFTLYACLASVLVGLSVALIFPQAYRKGFGDGAAQAATTTALDSNRTVLLTDDGEPFVRA